MVFLVWTVILFLAQSLLSAVIFAFISGGLVALGILIYQTKSEKLGLPYKRQTKIIELTFEDWRFSKQFPELLLIWIFQPAFFAAIFYLLVCEVLKWLI